MSEFEQIWMFNTENLQKATYCDHPQLIRYEAKISNALKWFVKLSSDKHSREGWRNCFNYFLGLQQLRILETDFQNGSKLYCILLANKLV